MPALVALVMLPLMLLNLLGGLVSGVWLAILGQWWALGIGVAALIAHAFLVPVVMGAGLMLLLPPVATLSSRGGAALASPFILLTQVFIYGIVCAWCIGIFHVVMSKADDQTYIPLLIWSYGIAVGPWAAMTARDRQSGSYAASAMASFFVQIAYMATGLEVLFMPATTSIIWLKTFLAIMTVGVVLQTILALGSLAGSRNS